jgi:hypothetical protein
MSPEAGNANANANARLSDGAIPARSVFTYSPSISSWDGSSSVQRELGRKPIHGGYEVEMAKLQARGALEVVRQADDAAGI